MIATPDFLWKYIIESYFAAFLRFFFNRYESEIDFERGFEFLDKELQQLFPESAASKRYVDKLIKVWLLNGQEKWVLVHVEVQGSHDANFAARMYQYHYRITDRYGVAVSSIAILTDDSKSWKPSRYSFDFMGTSVVFKFNIFKLVLKKRTSLLHSGNVFGFMMAAALDATQQARDAEKLRFKMDIAEKMFRAGHRLPDVREVVLFIRNYWKFEDYAFYRTFDNEIDLLTNNVQPMNLIEALQLEYKKEGLQQGLQEGLQQGLREGLEQGVQMGEDKTSRMHVRNMFLRGRFTKGDIVDILQVSPAMADEVAKSMFEAEEISLESLFGCGYSVTDLHELLKIEPEVLEAVLRK